MIEKILGTLKSDVGSQLITQAHVPSDQLDNVFGIIGDVTEKEVTQQMTDGNLTNVLNLFSKQQNNSGADVLQSGITSGVVNGLINKLGFSQNKASSIAQIAIPALINMVTNKNSETPDDDPSPLQEIFGRAGENAFGGVIGKFLK